MNNPETFSDGGRSVIHPNWASSVAIILSVIFSAIVATVESSEAKKAIKNSRPNVILIMSDDQGHGDFGVNGNPIIQTPNIDKMARHSASMSRFYVNAVCSPTRSSLMTGRWSYRTGVTDTFKGRSIMNSKETTIAEVLRQADYSTGIFGKWHLGDVYPYRPMDQGFDTAIYHRGGGLAQPSEPLEADSRYTNPVLFRNGEQYTAEGFCCDIYFSEAINFIRESQENNKPFFAYIASNTPHGPFHDVPEKWLKYYKGRNLDNHQFPHDTGHQIGGSDNLDNRARTYAMISNLDENVGLLFGELDKMNLTGNTLVIYMCDNGPNGNRYVSGFRGRKSNAFEGGVRSPFWAHWPNVLKPGNRSDAVSAHVDLFPTILEACGVTAPDGLEIDGRSMLGYLKGDTKELKDRTIILQSHRGEKPNRWENATLVTQRWKLVNNGKPGNLQLFDMFSDPYAQQNVIRQHPDIQKDLVERYDIWLKEMRSINPMDLPLHVGTDHEAETVLTIQDWKVSDQTGWGRNGEWRLNVTQIGTYLVSFNSKDNKNSPFTAELKINHETVATLTATETQKRYVFDPIQLREGRCTLKVMTKDNGKMPWHVFISKQ